MKLIFKLVLLFFLLAFIKLKAQDTTLATTTNIHTRLKMSVFIAPDFDYMVYRTDYPLDLFSLEVKEHRPKFGYSTGINLEYFLSNKISVQLESVFANMGKRRPKWDLNTNGNRNPALFAKDRYTFFYLNSNLSLKRYFSSKNKFYAVLGAILSFNIKNRGTHYLYWPDGSITVAKWKVVYNIPEFGLGANIGFGYVLATSSKINFYVEPNFSYLFTTIRNNDVKENLYAIGLRFGIGIKLK